MLPGSHRHRGRGVGPTRPRARTCREPQHCPVGAGSSAAGWWTDAGCYRPDGSLPANPTRIAAEDRTGPATRRCWIPAWRESCSSCLRWNRTDRGGSAHWIERCCRRWPRPERLRTRPGCYRWTPRAEHRRSAGELPGRRAASPWGLPNCCSRAWPGPTARVQPQPDGPVSHCPAGYRAAGAGRGGKERNYLDVTDRWPSWTGRRSHRPVARNPAYCLPDAPSPGSPNPRASPRRRHLAMHRSSSKTLPHPASALTCSPVDFPSPDSRLTSTLSSRRYPPSEIRSDS